jgi:hypothetical protein
MTTPNIPRFNKGAYYLTGCQMTYLTTTTMSIAVGQARDSTNSNDINVTSAVTINVRNNGVNGLDQGTFAPNTFYGVYVIGNSNANDTTLLAAAVQPTPPIQPPTTITASTGGLFQPGQAILSANLTTPVLPVGYDMYRRVGYILSNATAAPNTLILKFDQVGNNSQRWFYYDAPIVCLAATAQAGFTALNINVTNNSVPTPLQSNVLFEATLLPNAAGNYVALQPGSSANATGYYARMSGDVAAVAHVGDMTVPFSTVAGNPTINYKTDAASTVALNVVGYLDLL